MSGNGRNTYGAANECSNDPNPTGVCVNCPKTPCDLTVVVFECCSGQTVKQYKAEIKKNTKIAKDDNDDDGKVVFCNIKPGKYTVTCSKDGYETNSTKIQVKTGKNEVKLSLTNNKKTLENKLSLLITKINFTNSTELQKKEIENDLWIAATNSFKNHIGQIKNCSTMIIIDFRKKLGKERLWVVDLTTEFPTVKLDKGVKVSHGENSGRFEENSTTIYFSNHYNKNKPPKRSCFGAFITGIIRNTKAGSYFNCQEQSKPQISGKECLINTCNSLNKWMEEQTEEKQTETEREKIRKKHCAISKKALEVHGLEEGTNNQAYNRKILFHAASYMDGKNLGRSWGCFATAEVFHNKLIEEIGKCPGTFVYAYTGEKCLGNCPHLTENKCLGLPVCPGWNNKESFDEIKTKCSDCPLLKNEGGCLGLLICPGWKNKKFSTQKEKCLNCIHSGNQKNFKNRIGCEKIEALDKCQFKEKPAKKPV